MNRIEEQLWDYIDGNLDEAHAKTIADQIHSNPELKHQYEQLVSLNLTLNALSQDEPSLSFTRNVMESIAHEPQPVALTTKVNKKLIYGIGLILVLPLFSMFAYIVYYSDLRLPDFNLNLNFNLKKFFTPTAFNIFIFSDIVIGLIFLDHLLRSKAAGK
ncbi:anti-sigma factor [Pedobacter sp. BMA]|uniref:anti-sigma factor family protein n=1 Tax=Pedobacter sp. BMA TaxID=1663685 RepID=UPI00064AB0E0|nr:hypothetical protein [Pedobacter sp. BMA]KLT64570.1 hypothetical protein AB669_12440 [Pedobacter sp. BMA]